MGTLVRPWAISIMTMKQASLILLLLIKRKVAFNAEWRNWSLKAFQTQCEVYWANQIASKLVQKQSQIPKSSDRGAILKEKGGGVAD